MKNILAVIMLILTALGSGCGKKDQDARAKGIPIGKVAQVREDPSELFLSARIQPAVDVNAVEEVLIIEWPPSGSRS